MTVISSMENEKVYEFVTEALRFGYESRGISFDIVKGILETLKQNEKNIKLGFFLAQKEYLNDNLYNMYLNYKLYERPKFIVDQIMSLMNYLNNSNTFVDVGCGQNTVCEYLINNELCFNKAIGTDVIDYRKTDEKKDERIKFIKQSSSTELPLIDDEANFVLLANMLHHINEEEIYIFLREISRITSNHGVLLILEDSWADDILPIFKGNRLSFLFNNLGISEKIEAMKVIDLIGTSLFFVEDLEYSRPYNFKSINKWIEILSKYKFDLIDSKYIGFPQEKLHLNPQSSFAFTKRK